MEIYIAVGAVALIVGLLLGTVIGSMHRKRVAEKEIGSAEEQAARIVEEAIKTAESKKKESVLEAKEEVLKIRTDAENELKERRKEVSRQERRIQQKEESLDAKTEAIENKNELLNQKIKETEDLRGKIQETLDSHVAMLERIAGFTRDQARDELLSRMETALTHEKALKIAHFEEQFKDEAEEKAKDILSTAIQRCAADHVSEITISTVQLPNEDMKGRIIGREGRNIRSIETLTGCDLIIDDTPETITLSSFDPVRREVARIALEKLIADGRIHPARIEEMVEKARREVDATIKQAGEKATFETGVHGLHPDVIKLLGRLRYRTSYGQNVLRHSIEVSLLSGILASELGSDVTVAKRAGLLHDIGKALTQEAEGSHIQLGVEVAKKHKESQEVINAIEAHHGDVEPHTVVACLVQAADAISASRPGARRENIESYVKRLEKLEEVSKSFPGIASSYAIQAGREIRIMVKPEEVSEDQMVLLARDIAKKIEDELTYPGQIKVHVLRETKAVDYAK